MNRPGWAALRVLAVAAVVSAASAAGLAPVPQARAAGAFSMATTTTYAIDPSARRVDVAMSLTFRNTTPDRPGQMSLFRSIPLTLQAGASAISARDGTGPLAVSSSSNAAATLATVRLRTALRASRSVALTVHYRLLDGAATGLRVRPSLLVLPIWCFGTSGSATVRLPADYATQLLGAPMASTANDGELSLSSGPVTNTTAWRTLLIAARPASFVTATRTVALAGGTLDLRVRAWDDDAAWGTRTLDLAAAALPALQREIGLAGVPAGPLVLSEAPPAGFDPLAEPLSGGAREMAVSFDAGGFTLIHQLAHLWVGDGIASARWIREGLASHVAAIVGGTLGVAQPYDPVARGAASDPAAIPLDEWTGTEHDAWAYAASWAFVDRLAGLAGEAALRRAVQRAAAGTGPYESPDAGSATPLGTPPPAPLDSRALLDQLEEAGAPDLSSVFRATVFSTATGAQLPLRSDARERYAALVRAAGSWGAPRPVREAMAGWRFDEAIAQIDRDGSFLVDRDELLARAGEVGLSPPSRLAVDWRDTGGEGQSRAELEAERALVAAYAAARSQVGEPNPVEALGLLGGPRPSELLATAAGLYTAGDLAGALADVERATSLSAGAQSSGVVRVGLLAAALAMGAFLVAIAIRRVRQVLGRSVRRPPVLRPPSA